MQRPITPDPDLAAPDFTLPDPAGTPHTLSGARGRHVLVNFWATWCVPCVTEMPALQQLADAHPSTLHVWGVNVGDDAAAVRAFADAHALRFPLLLADDPTRVAYQVVGLPQTVLVNPRGEIVFRQFGPLDAAALTQLGALVE